MEAQINFTLRESNIEEKNAEEKDFFLTVLQFKKQKSFSSPFFSSILPFSESKANLSHLLLFFASWPIVMTLFLPRSFVGPRPC